MKYFEYDDRTHSYIARQQGDKPRSWLRVLLKNLWLGAGVGADIALALHFLK